MNRTKIGLCILLAVLISIQFIRPARNQKSGPVLATDITRIYIVPGKLQAVLETSCYDCHSNRTRYPWYSNIQPAGWLLASHIKEGKAELNFSEFGSYGSRRQQSKLKAIKNSVKDNSMPLLSYTIIHPDVRLSKNNKELIISWIEKTLDSLSKR